MKSQSPEEQRTKLLTEFGDPMDHECYLFFVFEQVKFNLEETIRSYEADPELIDGYLERVAANVIKQHRRYCRKCVAFKNW